MRTTPVGQRCPECVGKARVVRPRAAGGNPTVTYALIAANILVFLGVQRGLSAGLGSSGVGGDAYERFALYGPFVHDGDLWRMVTSMFLHVGLLHIGFNMYALYSFGPALEQRFGPVRYGALYLIAGLWGSAGALILTPDRPTVGASGAIFGLMGALVVVLKKHGSRDLGGIGAVIMINLVITFTLPGISAGGHVGGLIGGVLVAALLEYGGVFRQRIEPLIWVGAVALAGVAIVVGYLAAGRGIA